MAKISDLSEELLVKILSFLPTKDAVSTSVLSKQWKFLWMWCPDLDFDCDEDSVRDFINKNLPLYKAPFINSLGLWFDQYYIQPETFKSWVETAVSRGVRDLSICGSDGYVDIEVSESYFLPSSLYTSNSLVTLDLDGKVVIVDVPRTVFLPSLKKLRLSFVTYSHGDSLRLLLCCCPVLEDLSIDKEQYDNPRALVIKIPSLKRLSLCIIGQGFSDDQFVIVTPSLKYFKLEDGRSEASYLIEHMPELEEANISVSRDSYLEDLLKSFSNVKSLSLRVTINSGNENVYGDDIVFSRLEDLVLYICSKNWSMLTFQLLRDSPNLKDLYVGYRGGVSFSSKTYEPGWINNQNLVPECLLKSLKSFEFEASTEEEEENDFLSFIMKHACCLESA